MKRLHAPAWMALACCAMSAPAAGPTTQAAQAVIDTDFSRLAESDFRPLTGNDRVTGMLPPGWEDNSAWAKVWIDYSRRAEQGRGYLHVEIRKNEDGRAQLVHQAPDFGKETYFRYEITLRSRSGGTVETGLRLRDRPYAFLWSTTLTPTESWRTYTFEFRRDANPQPSGVWINFTSGSLDIARVRLVRMTREGLIAEIRARYGASQPRNLLRNTRMPLGLESGWSLGRDHSDGDDVRIAPDGDVPGPSGAPSLSIRSDEAFTLRTAPFGVPLACETHTASLYARGAGTLTLSIACDGSPVGQARSETLAPDTWKRLSVPFPPRLLARVYGLRLQGKGQVWIDALQVERGDKAGAYASQLDCEVSLAVDEPARVQFVDTPAEARWAVTGQADGAMLRAQVATPYGPAAALAPVKLGEGFLQAGTLKYGVAGAPALGPMRIEAWVEDAAGKPISPPNELVVYRLRRPRYWGRDAPNSFFGAHTNSTTRHILMAKSAGINWIRLHDAGTPYIGWFFLEPAKGEWRFRDKELKRYRRYGMKILGAFSTAPRWASYLRNERPHDGYFDRFYQPVDLDDFRHYVRTVTRRYKDGVIDTWDVWNEPWAHSWWAVDYDETKTGRDGYRTSAGPAEDFAHMVAAARDAARSVDPGASVCGVNTYGGADGGDGHTGGTEWTRGVLAAGGVRPCDVIAYHQYAVAPLGFPGDAMDVGFHAATDPILQKLGKLPRPVWMTEGSPSPQTLSDGFYRVTLPYPVEQDAFASADRLARYAVSLMSMGVRKMFLYSMHCHTGFGSTEFRVLVTPEGYLHPSAAGLSAAAWLLEDATFRQRSQPVEGVTAYDFDTPRGAVTVLAPGSEGAEYAVPATPATRVLDVFGNPLPRGAKLHRHLVYVVQGKTAEK